MEKGCYLHHRIGFGKLACRYALTGCVLEKYFSPAEWSRLDLSATHFFSRNVTKKVKTVVRNPLFVFPYHDLVAGL